MDDSINVLSLSSELYARELRKISIKLAARTGAAHLGSSLSCADIVGVLFSDTLRNYHQKTFGLESDHFILSKGHAATTLYGALFLNGFLSKYDLESYSTFGSMLEEHPNTSVPGVETATGSLGHGLPVGVGIALGDLTRGLDRTTYIVMSDGECNEGTVWEAAQFASSKSINNLICLIDHNKLQATGSTVETLGLINLQHLFEALDWHAQTIDGHSHAEIKEAIRQTRYVEKPSVIVCNTVKGKGVSFMENDNNWHYRAPSEIELSSALNEIDSK